MLAYGNHPFQKPSADLVVASADDIAFRVHKNILAEASSVFEHMFGSPQPQHDSSDAVRGDEVFDGLPVVHLTEHSTTLENLFRLCYPVRDPIITSLEAVRDTLVAATKYDMEEATELLVARLKEFAGAKPLQVYAIAYRHESEEVALAAAKGVYVHGLCSRYSPEMEDISAGAYNRLLLYCRAMKKGKTYTDYLCQPRRHSDNSANSSVPTTDGAEPDNASTNTLSHPFTMSNADFSNADFILRSSDHVPVDFHVHRIVVEMASPVLTQKIFQAVSAHHTATDRSDADLPVAVLEEKGGTISILLQLFYPNFLEPDLEDVQELVTLLAAAQKYRINKAVQLLSARLLAQNAEPMKVYLIACQFGLTALAKEGAKRILRLDDDDLEIYHAEMEDISAGQYYRLIQYHRVHREVVDRYTSDGQWISVEWRTRLRKQCTTRSINNGQGQSLPCWCTPYFRCLRDQKIGDVKAHDPFHLSIDVTTGAVESAFKRLTVSDACGGCRSSDAVLLMLQFSHYLTQQFSSAVSMTELEWT
ncbi:hypothetical protein BKA93DRAFT_800187 [Sparassis latifolia]|uniref:BTB domain-containing protein n=1 Tax=Sparassis crispa TaxID=139825 RepID=A0A401H548_9APHY|nr:hypothetical protein SCP_1602200 [Sparassis crispa]GBE89558.1 hypothetical protein SCP_1602200 [Sparassis crispa]